MTSHRTRAVRTFVKNRTAVVGLAMALLVGIIALLAPAVAPHDPLAQNVFYRLTPPESSHPFGTDFHGRDVFSRVLWASRISLLVGITAVGVAMVTGTALGLLAGWKGGRVGSSIMRLIDIWMSFPDEVLGIMLMVVVGTGLMNVIAVIGLLLVPRFTRLAYGPALALREKDYLIAARAIGAGDLRIIRRHLLPNMLGEVIVIGALWIGLAIRLEANLSFLGLGVAPPTATWGNMIRAGVEHLTNAPWVSLFPGLAILMTVLAFNMLGDGLRDAVDPKLRF